MSVLKKLARHWRDGTLLERAQMRLGRMPEHVRVHWDGARSAAQATRGLARWAQQFVDADPQAWVLSLGPGDAFHQALDRALEQRRVRYRALDLAAALALAPSELEGLKGIVCGHADARATTAAAQALARAPLLQSIPFEYAVGGHPERAQFRRYDEYPHTEFISPVLLDQPGPYALYQESLRHFRQKCGLRDYLDLYQVIRHVVAAGVPGDIAEFGSYEGHSGYLIARTLEALGSDKRVYLFDTFSGFPPERFGVDYFWNRSHQVDFEAVRARLAPLPRVQLLRGDFTQTLPAAGLGPLALAYIDCDSYRATRFLIDALWRTHLAAGAALVCEDYGHPALLGNRAAVHEALDGRPGAFRFFSQFSGLYITLKLAA